MCEALQILDSDSQHCERGMVTARVTGLSTIPCFATNSWAFFFVHKLQVFLLLHLVLVSYQQNSCYGLSGYILSCQATFCLVSIARVFCLVTKVHCCPSTSGLTERFSARLYVFVTGLSRYIMSRFNYGIETFTCMVLRLWASHTKPYVVREFPVMVHVFLLPIHGLPTLWLWSHHVL